MLQIELQIERLRTFFSERGLDFILAASILVLGFILSKIARRWLRPILNRSRIRDDQLLKDFFLRSFSFSITLVAMLAALGTVGFDVRAFLAGLGITGLILGFGLRDTLSNFASGVLLLIYRPFRAGEIIEVEGSRGVVEELSIVNMQMTTNDGVRVIMPNSKVWGAKIINYSHSERRRVEVTISVEEDKIDAAIKAINSGLASDSRILKTPAPTSEVSSITGAVAKLTLRAWTLPHDFEQVVADIHLRLYAELKRAGIKIL